jgi:hypothetical protein
MRGSGQELMGWAVSPERCFETGFGLVEARMSALFNYSIILFIAMNLSRPVLPHGERKSGRAVTSGG